LTLEETKELIKCCSEVEQAIKSPINKTETKHFESLKQIFEKSLAVNKDLSKGHVLTFDDLEAKKPKGYGIDASDFKSIIGRELKKSLVAWEFLNQRDIK
jgi:N-acetylneuraminate synthase